jgi:hypothetical protein
MFQIVFFHSYTIYYFWESFFRAPFLEAFLSRMGDKMAGYGILYRLSKFSRWRLKKTRSSKKAVTIFLSCYCQSHLQIISYYPFFDSMQHYNYDSLATNFFFSRKRTKTKKLVIHALNMRRAAVISYALCPWCAAKMVWRVHILWRNGIMGTTEIVRHCHLEIVRHSQLEIVRHYQSEIVRQNMHFCVNRK